MGVILLGRVTAYGGSKGVLLPEGETDWGMGKGFNEWFLQTGFCGAIFVVNVAQLATQVAASIFQRVVPADRVLRSDLCGQRGAAGHAGGGLDLSTSGSCRPGSAERSLWSTWRSWPRRWRPRSFNEWFLQTGFCGAIFVVNVAQLATQVAASIFPVGLINNKFMNLVLAAMLFTEFSGLANACYPL